MPSVTSRLPFIYVAAAIGLSLGVYGCSGSRPSSIFGSTAMESEAEAAQAVAEESSPAEQPGPWITTDSGLRYRILRKSTGRHPQSDDTVMIHYHGWLDDGSVFDTTYKKNLPATFPLNAVVPGFGEGLLYVGEGGMIELEIPGRLGYGFKGSPPKIPSNATLHFRIELLAIR
ncbi:FKBP-type peptidyl-prolyl cis-trans isomerase [Lignipirellula cremea]|uniref:Peptidyl-prolyl cis-trans isomerase n=1 Tax=Lignipirellula cremea TaxID=2528010 RepID=A0A518DQL7_9BACT|nr:FKBP-type peptidyl-prolyl cis-trans isomerase [Lignipirellula cremea]QDU94137.1 putative FKBP-type peptidyl-prolyl cis-trans isomerase FkpA precursor [Lignipirellula cremea]